MKKIIICGIICLICGSGCIDFDISMSDLGIIDVVSVNEKGDVSVCMDEEIYITDFSGSEFIRVTENDYYNGAVSWSRDGLLYVENPGDIWTLNLYTPGEKPTVVLQEMNRIAVPIDSIELGYVVLADEEEPFGNLNIYEKDTSRIYTLIENIYYDYEWVPGQRKIVAISVTSVDEDTFSGVLLIKDIDSLSEEVVFNGTFTARWDYVDIRRDNSVIFSSNGEIYLYNIETKELSKWQGPDGYDYRLPPSINSSLNGYVLAKVKGIEEEWGGQLYLVKPSGEFISVPAWPLWIEEPMAICVEISSLLVVNLEKNEVVDIIKKFDEYKKD